MTSKCKIHRYTAYFRGWATAFGDHEKDVDEVRGLTWLFGENQIGLILTPAVKRILYARLLGHRGEDAPVVKLGSTSLLIEDTEFVLGGGDRRAYETSMEMLRHGEELHLFQTYHLIYASGTRILSLSRRPPLPLVYRVIAPLHVHLI